MAALLTPDAKPHGKWLSIAATDERLPWQPERISKSARDERARISEQRNAVGCSHQAINADRCRCPKRGSGRIGRDGSMNGAGISSPPQGVEDLAGRFLTIQR